MATVENKTLDKQSLLAVKTAMENKNTYYTTASDTANAFTVSIPGVTELYDGLLVHVKFNAATASGATLNVNGLGAKAIYYRTATAITTHISPKDNYVTLIYDATNSHWVMQYNYDANSNTIAYQLRTNSAQWANKTGASMNRYMLFFEVDGGLSGAATTIATGTTKTVVNFKYIPGGVIKYNTTSGAVANNGLFGATGLWDQYTLDLRYTFNIGSTLTDNAPVYMRCIVNSDGTLTPDYSGSPSHPITQALPTTEDNKAYVYLGQAYSSTNIELYNNHPIYYYKNGAIRVWTNFDDSDFITSVTATERYLGVSYTAGTAVISGTTQYMHFSAGTTPKSSASFNGTKTNDLVTGVSVNSQGSVTLTANTATATGRIQYVESISGSAPSLTGTTTFVTNRGTFTAGSGSLTSNDTASGGIAYISSVSYTKQALSGTTSFNTDAIKSATLTASRSTSGSGTSARRTLTLSNTTSAATTASVSITDGAVTPTTKYLHHTHTASSLGAQSTNSVGISGGSYSGTLKYLSASHSGTTLTVTKGDYTPAGSVTLTAGTAPSLTFNTTASGGEAYIKSLSSGSVGGSVSLSENTATATGRIQYVKDIATN